MLVCASISVEPVHVQMSVWPFNHSLLNEGAMDILLLRFCSFIDHEIHFAFKCHICKELLKGHGDGNIMSMRLRSLTNVLCFLMKLLHSLRNSAFPHKSLTFSRETLRSLTKLLRSPKKRVPS